MPPYSVSFDLRGREAAPLGAATSKSPTPPARAASPVSPGDLEIAPPRTPRRGVPTLGVSSTSGTRARGANSPVPESDGSSCACMLSIVTINSS